MKKQAVGKCIESYSGEKTTFFVATNGNDAWSGKLPAPNEEGNDGPFATLVAARDAVREMKAKNRLKNPVTVMVREGKYFLRHTLVLNDGDSGTRECLIAYMAYPGEKPILSGGKKLTGWKPYKDNILQCAVPEARRGKWKFRQLFFNGQRQMRACWPKPDPEDPRHTGWALVEGPVGEGSASPLDTRQGYVHVHGPGKSAMGYSASAFKYKPGISKRRWAKPAEAEVNVFFAGNSLNSIIPVQSLDEDGRIITLRRDLQEVWQFNRSPWYTAFSYAKNNRFRVENVLEELDRPGEWCLDSDNGILYFWPPGELGEDSEVVAPALNCLVYLGGASWVTLSGLTFTETLGGDDPFRANYEGYGAMFPRQGLRYAGETLRMQCAEHCVIEKNHFHAVGANAIYLEGHNARNVIRHNEISHAGANGICMAGSKDEDKHPIFNRVEYNDIHHCGAINRYVAGVFLAVSDGNVVGHNAIHHMPHHAINLGSSGYGRNIVEYNDVRHTCLDFYDTGAINCWMEDPNGRVERVAERSGHIIRYNLILDTWGCAVDEEGRVAAAKRGSEPSVSGIYLDNSSSNCFVYGNIIARTLCGVTVHNAKNNVIENNIFVDCRYLVRWAEYVSPNVPRMVRFMTGNRFCGNISYNTEPEAFLFAFLPREAWSEKVLAESDRNLLFKEDGSDYVLREASGRLGGKEEVPLAEWQRLGYDTHSVIADPLFVDPKHDDYRLRPESPTFQLGFQPIPVEKIGMEPKRTAGVAAARPGW